MTARRLQLLCRDVAIWCARRGGMLVSMIAPAFGLSVRRVQVILRRMRDPRRQSAALEKILDAMKNPGKTGPHSSRRAAGGRARGASRAAIL